MDLTIKDVRAEMPNYENYKSWQRNGQISGIAIHHSATADRTTGAPIGDAHTFFDYHVHERGWAHGGYNYVITGSGEIEYALDEKIAAYHAGFADPDNSDGLEQGQYWNNHYLAICLAGWFSEGRAYRDNSSQVHPIPNNFTVPTSAQMDSLLALVQYLRKKYQLSAENVRGHRELAGNATTCPGSKFDPAQFRARLRAADEVELPSLDVTPPASVNPGEHVLLLPDTDKYLNAAMVYIWKFRPDVSFAVKEARGRWKYVTVVGNSDNIGDDQLTQLRLNGIKFIQYIAGDPQTVQTILDGLAQMGHRFQITPGSSLPELEPVPEPWRAYTIQAGDTLWAIARQVYSQGNLWHIIFEANRDTLSAPGRLTPGQVLKIPPKPDTF